MDLARRAVAVSVVGLPLMTWYAARPATSTIDLGFSIVPVWGVLLLGLLVITGVIVAPWEPTIALFCALVVLNCLRSTHYELLAAVSVVVGAVVASQLARVASLVRLALCVFAGLELLLFVGQWLGVWITVGEWGYQTEIPHGTFGNPRYFGLALAMIAPLAPWWLAGLLVVGVALSGSYIGLVACATALLVKYSAGRAGRLWVCAASGGGLAILLTIASTVRGLPGDSVGARIAIWRFALADWWSSWTSVLLGHGSGSWFTRMLKIEFDGGARFHNAHNEYLQLGYAYGLLGLGLAGWFCWTRRAWFRREPALIALALIGLAYTPFHIGALGVIALAVLGIASAEGAARGARA